MTVAVGNEGRKVYVKSFVGLLISSSFWLLHVMYLGLSASFWKLRDKRSLAKCAPGFHSPGAAFPNLRI